MEHVKHELVARMDADDISVPDRFECQLCQFEKDLELSVAIVGTLLILLVLLKMLSVNVQFP